VLPPEGRRRALALFLLAFGLVAQGVNLLLLKHHESPSQLIPLFLIAGAIVICFVADDGAVARGSRSA
jgi:hypothetical protein